MQGLLAHHLASDVRQDVLRDAVHIATSPCAATHPNARNSYTQGILFIARRVIFFTQWENDYKLFEMVLIVENVSALSDFLLVDLMRSICANPFMSLTIVLPFVIAIVFLEPAPF